MGGGTRPEIDGQLSSNKVVAGCVTTGDRYTHTLYTAGGGGGGGRKRQRKRDMT